MKFDFIWPDQSPSHSPRLHEKNKNLHDHMRERERSEREKQLITLTCYPLSLHINYRRKAEKANRRKRGCCLNIWRRKNTNKLQHNRETPSQFNDPSCISLKWDRATHQVWKFSSFPHKAQNALSSWIIACRLLPISLRHGNERANENYLRCDGVKEEEKMRF